VVHKNVPHLFAKQLRETLTNFNIFWQATSRKNAAQMIVISAILLWYCRYTTCEMQKS